MFTTIISLAALVGSTASMLYYTGEIKDQMKEIEQQINKNIKKPRTTSNPEREAFFEDIRSEEDDYLL